jgi:polar amino acid transport system permease protein
MRSLAVLASFDFSFFFRVLWPPWNSPFLVAGGLVLMITLIAQTAAIALGFILALGRISRNPLFKKPVDLYLYLFRGTPLLLQILLMYEGLAELTGNPAILFPITHNAIVAGTLTLALNEAAYMTEIIRAGLQAVDPGQIDAARALGMRRHLVMFRIVVPQALRIIVPPTFNEYINMSKNTSLLSTIAVPELLYTAESYYTQNFRVFESLALAAVYYLIITSFLTAIQRQIEARFGERQEERVAGRPLPPWRRLLTGAGQRDESVTGTVPEGEVKL